MTPSLPTPGASVDVWGDDLNEFLEVSHNSDGTLVSAEVQSALGGSRSLLATAIPSALGWPSQVPLGTITYQDILGVRQSVATLGLTAKSLFDSLSTARTAPGTTYYVNISTGNDSNAGTSGSPFKSIWKAVEAANTAGAGNYLVLIAPGVYPRVNNVHYGTGGAGTVPAAGVNMAFCANGGRVQTGTFDFPIATPSRDGTYTQCYTWSLANADAIYDTTNLDRFGMYTKLQYVATTAICNATPNSWTISSSTVYVNRADQQVPTSTNTRAYRTSTMNVYLNALAHFYFGGVSGIDGIDFEGGDTVAGLHVTIAGSASGFYALVAENCTFRYAQGGAATGAQGTAPGVRIDSWPGINAFFNCDASANATDGFNHHDANTNPNPYRLTVNCTGFNNGCSPNQSDNGWTSHDDTIGIDLCGYYEANHGGTCYSINAAKAFFGRTTVAFDLGDIPFGGSIQPTAFRADNTVAYYCDRTRIFSAAGDYGYYTGTNTATIYQHDVEPCSLPNGGVGAFANF